MKLTSFMIELKTLFHESEKIHTRRSDESNLTLKVESSG